MQADSSAERIVIFVVNFRSVDVFLYLARLWKN